jgi:hypothetical protein
MSKTQQSSELVRHSTNVAALAEFESAVIYGKRIEFLDDPRAIQREILLQLQAASDDDELEPAEAQGWRTLLDVPVRIKGFRWLPSDEQYISEDSSTVFVVIFGTRLDTDEPVVLTTGGVNVLIQLSNLARRDRLPAVRALKESKPSRKRVDETTGEVGGGFKSLWLYTPDEYAREAEPVEEAEVVEL